MSAATETPLIRDVHDPAGGKGFRGAGQGPCGLPARPTAAEELLQDCRERRRIREASEPLREHAVQQDLVANLRRLVPSDNLIPFREHGLTMQGPTERVESTAIEGDDLEEPVEGERTNAVSSDDRHSDAIHLGVQGRVRLKGFAADPDLEQPEVGGRSAVRCHVPMLEGFHGVRDLLVAEEFRPSLRSRSRWRVPI